MSEDGISNNDPKSAQRKTHHLEYAKEAQVESRYLNEMFDYEPLLNGFPKELEGKSGDFNFQKLKVAGKTLKAPVWISSMTGGASAAGPINKKLAVAAREFGLGLGLGSCRPLLNSDDYFEDFNLRDIAGDDIPLFANFGVAQVEDELQSGGERLFEICDRLKVDGVFLHINPLQEWFQPEGDRWSRPPLEIIQDVIELNEKKGCPLSIGVKEVGQGMGPRSLKALLEMPLEVIEFAAFGGTNFSYLEGLRHEKPNENNSLSTDKDLCYVGHTAQEMVRLVNQFLIDESVKTNDKFFIISGGVRSSLQGHFLTENLRGNACYGMAKPFLEAAQGSEEELISFVRNHLEGLKMAQTFLVPKPLS